MKGFNYRKLEIQVLGARPMSEVGFRDVRASPQNSQTPQRQYNINSETVEFNALDQLVWRSFF